MQSCGLLLLLSFTVLACSKQGASADSATLKVASRSTDTAAARRDSIARDSLRRVHGPQEPDPPCLASKIGLACDP